MKSADEIVRALQNYASDCGADEACFQCTVAWMCDELGGNAPKIIANTVERLQSKLAAYEDTGLSPDEIPQWHDGPLPKCGPEEMPWFVIEAPSWIGGLPDYEVVRWMGEHWSDKRADRAEKWMKLSLPQPPKEEK